MARFLAALSPQATTGKEVNMSNAAQVIETNQSLFDDCRSLLKHPKFAAEIGPQFDRDTLDQPMAPAVIECIVANSPLNMRPKLAKQLQSRMVNPLRQRKAIELRKEKKQRTSDPNRKRHTRAWNSRHVPAAPPDSPSRLSNGQPPESTRCNRFFGVLQEIRKQLRDKEGFVSMQPHEAIPLAGRVILMAALIADTAAKDWLPRLTEWQDVPWDYQRDGERLDGHTWVDDDADVDRVTGTRYMLRKFMFEGPDWKVKENLDLIDEAVKQWKRLAESKTGGCSNPAVYAAQLDEKSQDVVLALHQRGAQSIENLAGNAGVTESTLKRRLKGLRLIGISQNGANGEFLTGLGVLVAESINEKMNLK